MTALEFVRTMKRMCKETTDCGNCGDCIISNYSRCFLARKDFSAEKLVERFEKWAAEHPDKTRLQDFMERNPKAFKNFVLEMTSPISMGYCGERESCGGCKYIGIGHPACWNLSVYEVVD